MGRKVNSLLAVMITVAAAPHTSRGAVPRDRRRQRTRVAHVRRVADDRGARVDAGRDRGGAPARARAED